MVFKNFCSSKDAVEDKTQGTDGEGKYLQVTGKELESRIYNKYTKLYNQKKHKGTKYLNLHFIKEIHEHQISM